MRMLVTGAGGMLGSDIVAAAQARGHDCVGLARAQLDVSDAAAVAEAIARAEPEVVVNCAAWTDVDGAEADEAAALAVNGTGAGHVARAALAAGARVVQISTDYVFDGTATAPYVESDRTGPCNAYGRTKLAGEHAVLAASAANAVVRTSWLFGANGPNFAATMLRLADAGQREVAVVTDQVACPTFTGHLAVRVVELAEQGRGGIFHVAAGGHCSWNAFARAIFEAAGLDVEVTETDSTEFVRPAARPAWSVLGTERDGGDGLPAWTEGVVAYLELVRGGVVR